MTKAHICDTIKLYLVLNRQRGFGVTIMAEQDMIFNKIAESLLLDYSSVYYVNVETNEYYW